jgi:hypothetical protein
VLIPSAPPPPPPAPLRDALRMKWSKLTQDELRALLAAFGLPIEGGKPVLVARVTARVSTTTNQQQQQQQQQQKDHSDGAGTTGAVASGNESCMPAGKRPRHSEPLSPPTGTTGPTGAAAVGSSSERTSQLQHRLRDLQARRQSKAQELSSLQAEVDLIAKEEVALRVDVAADHNRTRCSLVMLPNEVRQLLLGMVGIQALGRLAATSRDLQHSLTDPVIWRMIAHAADAKDLRQLLGQMCADVELATICCQRVRKIGNGGQGVLTAEGTAFNAAGGCEALVAAMRSHASVAKLQTEACRALRTLSRSDEGRAAALAAGSADAMVAALRAHPSVAGVQEQGCVAVGYLVFSDEGVAEVLAAGGAEAVVGAMRAHVGVAGVQAAGSGAVANVAFSDEGIAALLAAGGAEAVVAAMRAHVGVVAVQIMGCCAVETMATGNNAEGIAAVLVAAGGAEAVVGALRAHVGVAVVQERGCAAVAGLACIAECKAALKRAGAEQLARDAARNHPTNTNVQRESGRVLTNLS